MKTYPLLAAACGLATLPSALAGQAAESDEDARPRQLPSAVVTGELWRSPVEETSASVTVLGEERLLESGADHFEDVIPSIPNLTWTGGTSRPRYLQIRGIGENSQFSGQTPDSSVRFMVDDLDFTGIGGVAGLFDVKQVEVLRGPQAGAFGANASGGMVRVLTKDPTPYWDGYVQGGLASDDLREAELAVGGPILERDPDRLMFRLALKQHVSDGFQDNRFLNEDDTNERDEFMSRLKLRWNSSPDWTWDGTLFFADQDNGFDEFSLSNADHETFSDEPGRDEQESLAGSLKGVWSGAADWKFTTLTNATRADSLYSFDADWENAADPRSFDGFTRIDRLRRVANQEFRFDSTEGFENAVLDRWTLGVRFHSLDEETDFDFDQGKPPDFGLDPGRQGFDLSVDSTYEARSAALFGQAAHHFTEDTRLILGLRGEYHAVDVVSSDGGLFAGGESEEADPLFGGKLTLEHDLDGNRMLFASAARGYRAAGANVGGFVPANRPLTFDDETLWNFEGGLRGEWLDGNVSGKLTAFYLRRNDTQLRDSQGSGGFFTFFTQNGREARHYGLEGEVSWRIDDRWTATANFGLLETEREEAPGIGFPNERELPNSPDYSYSARLAYDEGRGFFANAELSGRDGYFQSNRHDQKLDAFAIVNAAAGYRWDRWTVRVWSRNLFDEEYAKRVFFFDNTRPFGDGQNRFEVLADPRQVGVSLRYEF